MSALRYVFAGLGLAFVIGCGGGGGGGGQTNGVGVVSGNVADLDGNPVRNAKVFPLKKPTRFTLSNSSGAFTLSGVEDEDTTIAAEVVVGGVSYYGENTIRVFANEQSKSLNLIIGRRDRMARFKGTIVDRFSDPIEGARVFANNGSLGSVVAVSDKDGEFQMFLHANYDYTVSAGALGFDSDTDVIRLNVAEIRNLNFVLSNPSDVGFNPPANFTSTAWTSPRETTRSPQLANSYEAIKRAIDPRRARNASRKPLPKNTTGGNWIEVDSYWDPVQNDSLLGYGIYRGTSQTGPTKAIEFLRDPLAAFFADADSSLREGVNYYYEITALNVNYPDTFNSESDFSDRFGVRPLGDCILKSVTAGSPVRFNWNATSGAERYTVYVFDAYPNYGINAFWPTNAGEIVAATTTGTSLNYAGPALGNGTYYYIVLAVDTRNSNDARSISKIGSFIVN